MSAVKVTIEFNEKFSTSISPETVGWVLRATGLNGHFAGNNFFSVWIIKYKNSNPEQKIWIFLRREGGERNKKIDWFFKKKKYLV